MRRGALLLVAAVAACAGRPRSSDPLDSVQDPPDHAAEREGPKDRDSERLNFIKLANRRLGLAAYYPGGADQVALDADQFESRLSAELGRTYQTKVPIFRRDRTKFLGFDPPLFAALADAQVDDVVVVEVSAPEAAEASAHVRVFAISKEAPIVDFSTQLLRAQLEGGSAVPGLVHQIWHGVAKSFTDPAAAAPADQVAMGIRLLEMERCDLAAPVLRKFVPSMINKTIIDGAHRREAEGKLRTCERFLARQELLRQDKLATFRLDLEASELAPRIREAMKRGVRDSKLADTVRAFTTKPAKVLARPSAITLEIRYHPELYKTKTAGLSLFPAGQHGLELEVYIPLMTALVDARDLAAAELPPYDAQALSAVNCALRLTKVEGDYVEIDFVERQGSILFTDSLRVRLEGRPEMTVRTEDPGELRHKIFVLGAPTTLSGKPTDHGLVYQFFDLGR
jgi:hypothetical protein